MAQKIQDEKLRKALDNLRTALGSQPEAAIPTRDAFGVQPVPPFPNAATAQQSPAALAASNPPPQPNAATAERSPLAIARDNLPPVPQNLGAFPAATGPRPEFSPGADQGVFPAAHGTPPPVLPPFPDAASAARPPVQHGPVPPPVFGPRAPFAAPPATEAEALARSGQLGRQATPRSSAVGSGLVNTLRELPESFLQSVGRGVTADFPNLSVPSPEPRFFPATPATTSVTERLRAEGAALDRAQIPAASNSPQTSPEELSALGGFLPGSHLGVTEVPREPPVNIGPAFPVPGARGNRFGGGNIGGIPESTPAIGDTSIVGAGEQSNATPAPLDFNKAFRLFRGIKEEDRFKVPENLDNLPPSRGRFIGVSNHPTAGDVISYKDHQGRLRHYRPDTPLNRQAVSQEREQAAAQRQEQEQFRNRAATVADNIFQRDQAERTRIAVEDQGARTSIDQFRRAGETNERFEKRLDDVDKAEKDRLKAEKREEGERVRHARAVELAEIAAGPGNAAAAAEQDRNAAMREINRANTLSAEEIARFEAESDLVATLAGYDAALINGAAGDRTREAETNLLMQNSASFSVFIKKKQAAGGDPRKIKAASAERAKFLEKHRKKLVDAWGGGALGDGKWNSHFGVAHPSIDFIEE